MCPGRSVSGGTWTSRIGRARITGRINVKTCNFCVSTNARFVSALSNDDGDLTGTAYAPRRILNYLFDNGVSKFGARRTDPRQEWAPNAVLLYSPASRQWRKASRPLALLAAVFSGSRIAARHRC